MPVDSNQNQGQYPRWLFPLVLVIFFLSGACGLIYEVVWMKRLGLVFGATALATSTILVTFMAGLALGSFWLGRLADRHPLRLYGLLELGVGLFAFIMPAIFTALDSVYLFAYRDITQAFFWLSLIRFVLSLAVLLAPTVLMGGTLPVIVHFLSRRSDELGKRAGQMYFINTLGAVLGSLATGFFLIAVLGLNEAAYAAGAVNTLIAITAFIVDRKLSAKRISSETALIAEPESAPRPHLPPKLSRLTLWVIGISGFCSLAYEVLWTRALVFMLDNTAQAFTTMLTAFLFGLALGSLLVTRWVDRVRRLFLVFGLTELLIGLLALLSIPIFGNIGASLGGGSDAAYPTSVQWAWALLRFARSFLVMLLPTVLMGMTLPLAIRIYGGDPSGTGRAVGRVYAVNTLGGMVGSFAAGFVLIPLAGVYHSVLLIAALNAVLGVVLLLAQPAIKNASKLKAAIVTGLTFVTTLAVLLSYGQVMFFSPIERTSLASVLYYRDGIGATVKVYMDVYGDKTLSIDGFPVAGTIARHQDGQKTLGSMPLLLTQTDNPSINIIGFGAGGSSWAATLYDTKSIECVEIVPDVLEAAKLFPEVNHGVLANPRLAVITGDGRNHLLLTQETYDIISVDATSPKSSGSGSLYTQDFYESCQAHLSAGGLMVQWLPYHLLSPQDVKMTVRTFQQVFPHASLWFSFQRYYFLLVGTQQPLRLDLQRMQGLVSQETIQEELNPLGISDAYDIMSCFIMNEEALRAYASGARLNTDDHPYLEYEPVTSYLAIEDHVRANLTEISPLRQSVWPYLVNTGESAAAREAAQTALAQRIEATPIQHFFPQYIQ